MIHIYDYMHHIIYDIYVCVCACVCVYISAFIKAIIFYKIQLLTFKNEKKYSKSFTIFYCTLHVLFDYNIFLLIYDRY